MTVLEKNKKESEASENIKKNDNGKLKHLAGNLYAVKGKSQIFSDSPPVLLSNSLYIDEDKEKAIIDPSGDYNTMIKISNNHRIDKCFFSHSHFDHSSCFHYFRDSEYYIHEDEKIVYSSLMARWRYLAPRPGCITRL